METTSINLGYQPASSLRRKENAINAILLAPHAFTLKLSAIIKRTIGAALTHRAAVGGVALISGMVLASGADTIPQALITLAAFMVAGACLREEEEKGGAA